MTRRVHTPRVLASGASTLSTLRGAAASGVVRQSAGYVVATLVSNAITLVTTILLTRILSVESYAEYAFSLNLLLFLALFFEFGMFYPAAQLIATASAQKARSLTGAAVILWLAASALLSTSVLISTLGLVQILFKVNVSDELRTIAPLAGAWLAMQLALLVAQGHGRLHVYSATNVLTGALFLTGVLGSLAVGRFHDAQPMLILYGVTSMIGSITCLAWFRPDFRWWTSSCREILAQTRDWGVNVFVGRVLSMATYRLDVLMLAALAGGTQVATYVLATALTAPIALPGLASATALFKRMTGSKHVEAIWILFPLGLAVAGTVTLALAGDFIVDLIFSSDYADVVPLLVPLALAAALQGTTAVYNRFLAAHQRGKELRTAGLWLAGSNVVFNIALIPPFSAAGAAWASVLALLVNLVSQVLPYHRLAVKLAVEDGSDVMDEEPGSARRDDARDCV